MKILVTPENSTVQGYENSKDYWKNLRFDEAEPRKKSMAMVYLVGSEKAPIDIHLSVPFAATGDEHFPSEDLGYYRVRPKDKSISSVEKIDNQWFWIKEV